MHTFVFIIKITTHEYCNCHKMHTCDTRNDKELLSAVHNHCKEYLMYETGTPQALVVGTSLHQCVQTKHLYHITICNR